MAVTVLCKRQWTLFVCAAWCCFLLACSYRPPALPPLATDDVVLAFGDSLTFGTGANRDQSYPAALQNAINRTVVNAGVPGELSAAGLTRLPALLDKHHPALVIICHGGNDLLQRRNEREMLTNVRQMVLLSQDSGASVILLGVPKPAIFLSTLEGYERLANDVKIPYEGRVLTKILSDARLKSDAAHPNALGYQQMAESVVTLLHLAGAL